MTSKSDPSRRRSPGRPRSQRAHRAVLDAARALIEETGCASATVEAIAARSGVAKTTIYRRWPNRPSLLVDLLVDVASEVVPVPHGGNPLESLRTELHQTARAADDLAGRLMTALVSEAQHDRGVRAAFLERFLRPRREASAGAIRRAQVSGELRPDVTPDVAVDMLFGPLLFRMLFRHRPVTEEFTEQVCRFVLEGLRARGEPDG